MPKSPKKNDTTEKLNTQYSFSNNLFTPQYCYDLFGISDNWKSFCSCAQGEAYATKEEFCSAISPYCLEGIEQGLDPQTCCGCY